MNPTNQPALKAGNYVSVNSLNMYYETWGGTGKPLVLLHGGVGAIEMFGEALPLLAAGRHVNMVSVGGVAAALSAGEGRGREASAPEDDMRGSWTERTGRSV